ncbi:MAG: hypothetical protein P1V51_24520 [Deltaproteobacteria bacterium]|nr:hypothetical protein [Deltaproteobacteria bacterium]
MITNTAERAMIVRVRESGVSIRDIAIRFALDEEDIREVIDAAFSDLPVPFLSPEAAPVADPTPAPDPEGETPMAKKTCNHCDKPLRPNNRSGVHKACRKYFKPEAKPARKKTSKRPAASVPVEMVTLPDVVELPAEYLAACVREVRRRVAGAELLAGVLEESEE